jgi:hypothetical protein
MSDHEILEEIWLANEAWLKGLYALDSDRELNAAKIERGEGNQDKIEWRLDRPAGPPCRWSGAP